MIYPYKYYSKHNVVNLHIYIEYFFDEMHKRSSKQFNQKVIHKDFLSLAKKKKEILLNPMKEIYKEYKKLDISVQNEIIKAFKINNSISELCNGKKEPLKYTGLTTISSPLSKVINTFFTNLYDKIISKHVFDSQTDHFIKFRTLNERIKICPFCGLEPLLSRYEATNGKKDDYDHWLSKGKYPFNSVNFKNLVPMCSKCNQKYKSQKDTLFLKNKKTWNRRLVIYPYGKKIKPNSITAKIEKSDYSTTLKNDNTWSVNINGPMNLKSEIESWDQIFHIKSRYKDRIRDRYELNWYDEVLVKLYKKKRVEPGFTFIKFKEDIYFGIRPFHLQESSIIEKAYYDFFFSDPDCEKNLENTL